ncbi:MAG: tRNA (adenosine(37)-N6)-threonylcarbamoyltransferase complex dimerization subunit type 1 TsaB [Candidatus Peribacteraceae bacterium]
MKVFFLDLASHEKLFALATENQTVRSVKIDDHTDESGLLPKIEALLKEAGWTFGDLTHIAAVTGPGGFMSLRVGISLANALSWSLKIPLAGIHLSDVWFSRAQSSKLIAHSFIWLHSTKKNLLFIRGFGELSKEWPDPILISIDELAAKSHKLIANCYLGELIEEHKKTLPGLKPATKLRPVADVLPELLKKCEFKKNRTLVPWYGRSG